jgi:hypothetical protein
VQSFEGDCKLFSLAQKYDLALNQPDGAGTSQRKPIRRLGKPLAQISVGDMGVNLKDFHREHARIIGCG